MSEAFTTATQMLAALRARRLSALELLDLHRRRVARYNPELNAIVEPNFEQARRDGPRGSSRGSSAASRVRRGTTPTDVGCGSRMIFLVKNPPSHF